VTAAFIGPGTVTKATTAGANYGYALVWAIVFSVFATVVFQEMAARLGIVTKAGLGEAIRQTITNPVIRFLSLSLVVTAIVVGNAAYQAGNIAGAATGLATLTDEVPPALLPSIIGLVAFAVLMLGHYRLLQNVLIALVVAMSCVFLATAIAVRPDISVAWNAVFPPTIPTGGLPEVLALIGTTVVPYNLFLHASASATQWPDDNNVAKSLSDSRLDTTLSVTLGGLVTLAIIATATAAFFNSGTKFENLSDAARQLEPLLGSYSKWLFCGGLFAAGLTSAITAPMAAAYAAAGCFGWPIDLRDFRLRVVFTAVILCGTFFAAIGRSPTEVITVAQIANGILLPLLAIYLIYVMNNRQLLGDHRNGIVANILGSTTVAVVALLGIRNLYVLLLQLV
jgi:NRAMP (natural resistance-associated macrophage protein)-like metal ion transporter